MLFIRKIIEMLKPAGCKQLKFACVELSTKSGKIWDGAKEKPNYLSDPNVIDATSFGCWSSALKGEHLPLTWLKLRSSLRGWYHNLFAPNLSKLNYHAYLTATRLINRSLNKFHNLAYLSKFDVVMVVVHDYSIPDMAKLLTASEKLSEKPVFIATLGNTFNSFRESWKTTENYMLFKKIMENCDVFVNFCNEIISLYLEQFSDTPILNLPMIYPFDFAKSFFEKHQNKDKIIFISGSTQRSDHVSSLIVAKKIQEKHPEFLIETIGRPIVNLEPLRGTRYKVIPPLRWINYLKHTRKAYLIIDMDSTWTVGRVVGDAAAVGTPCIGINSGNQLRLFPDLSCSDVSGIEQAIDLGNRLIEDRKFYERLQRKAFRRLEAQSYRNSVKRLKAALKGLNLGNFD